MVLYRLFVLAWAFKRVHTVGNNAMGRVNCDNGQCLPCRRFVSDFVWTRNTTEEDCNCTLQQLSNFDPYVKVHTVQSYNETSGQCLTMPDAAATEFDLLMTGFEDRNIPFVAGNAVMRPARVYVKAVAACSSRQYNTDYTQGVVRVHEHFGIRLIPPFVYVMYNGSWEMSTAHMRGTFFMNDDEMVSSPFHEMIFDLSLDSTAIFYNKKELVNTSLHAHQMFGGIQLDGASGPWMNWLAVYDNQCEVNCFKWDCVGNDCVCVDVLPTPPPVVEVEDAGLLIVILFVMLTNIGCLILFTVFWRCYGKTQREAEGRRSKRNSSMYSARGSAYGRRSTMGYNRDPSFSTRTESQGHSAFGRSLSDNIRASNPGRAPSRRESQQDSIRLTSRVTSSNSAKEESKKEDLKPPKPSGKPKVPKPTKNSQPKKPKPKKKPRQKPKNKNRSDADMVPTDSLEDSKSKKDNKKKKKSAAVPSASKDAKKGVIQMTEANAVKDSRTKKRAKQANSSASQERVKTEAKASADAVAAVELNHQNVEQNVAERTTRDSKPDKNPSVVGLVHAANKRKDSEPKAEAQSFSLQKPNPSSSLPVKISFARSSSSSDNMGKEDTPASSTTNSTVRTEMRKTVSPELSEIERERVIEPPSASVVQTEELQTRTGLNAVAPGLILYE